MVVVARQHRLSERNRVQAGRFRREIGRAVSAPRTISASRASDGSPSRPNSLSMVSNVQRSPSWLNSTSLMSNGMAPLSRATFGTWSGSTNRMCAWASRNAGSARGRRRGRALAAAVSPTHSGAWAQSGRAPAWRRRAARLSPNPRSRLPARARRSRRRAVARPSIGSFRGPPCRRRRSVACGRIRATIAQGAGIAPARRRHQLHRLRVGVAPPHVDDRGASCVASRSRDLSVRSNSSETAWVPSVNEGDGAWARKPSRVAGRPPLAPRNNVTSAQARYQASVHQPPRKNGVTILASNRARTRAGRSRTIRRNPISSRRP